MLPSILASDAKSRMLWYIYFKSKFSSFDPATQKLKRQVLLPPHSQYQMLKRDRITTVTFTVKSRWLASTEQSPLPKTYEILLGNVASLLCSWAGFLSSGYSYSARNSSLVHSWLYSLGCPSLFTILDFSFWRGQGRTQASWWEQEVLL